ncbi:replication initiator protein [Limimaricola soesokkakensis]|uniref:Initiator Replication protein n=1 Tax=Limimaricola soesokkakensis TaxID=1343159 RepID=A0A1X7A0H9_9RHOB|nr:replication initiation protein [Limimaricola soesokkakensis]PSK81548.1 replication initiator protein [Limimaricola soesokkakensis]SLN67109.1 Initiator Replication protein [Limimaricola soesokkakensis]
MSGDVRVLALTPSRDEAIKPSELIQITGHQTLTLNARRAITILWHNAHQQGIREGKDYSIELAELRTDGHKGSEMIEEAIVSLMQTILTVRLSGGRTRRVQFLGGNDMDDPDRSAGVLTYSFDKRLVEMLRDSSIWGKIALPVLMAFSSKYAVSLYENASQWSNLSRKVFQEITLEEFRQMLGVEEGKYPAFGALNKHVLKPAADEINALAPFNITLAPLKTGRRVTHIRVGWWRKSEEELKAAWAEAQRPKVGRRARILGKVQHLAPGSSISSSLRKERLSRNSSPNASLLDEE